MNILEKKIKHLLKKNKVSVKDFCAGIEMTEQNLYHIFRKDDTSFSNIKKISNFFNIPVLFFFNDAEDVDSVLPVVNLEQKSIEYWKKKYLNEKKEKLQERKEKRILIDTLSK